MKLPASELKSALKKLGPVRSDTYFIGSSISAQDSDAWVVVGVDLGLGEPFNLNGKKLTSVVNRMSGDVDITRQDRKLILKSARATVELEILPTKVPALPPEPTDWLTLELDGFKKNLGLAATYASTKKAAQFGDVVQVRTTPLGFDQEVPVSYDCVATDGNSMAVLTNVAVLTKEFSYLLNLECAAVVQLMDFPRLTLAETETNLWIRSGDTTVICPKSAKSFPDYPRFVPAKSEFIVQLSAPEFVSALRTVETLIEDTDKGAVALHFQDGVLSLGNIGVGSTARDQVSYEQLEPDPVFDPKDFQIKVAAKYLSSFLSKAPEFVTIGFSGSLKPIKIEYGNMTGVMMPIGRA